MSERLKPHHRPGPPPPWSESETAQLKLLVEAGSGWEEIEAAIGRTADACRQHLRRVGFDYAYRTRRKMRPWTEEEDDYLRQASRDRTPIKQVCSHLGRTFSAIHKRTETLGIGIGRSRQYTDDEIATIKTLAKQGKHYHQIGKVIGRKHTAVKAYCLKHGIAVKPMKQPWTLAEKTIVAAALKDTVESLSARLNRSPRSVLSILLTLSVKYGKTYKPIKKRIRDEEESVA